MLQHDMTNDQAIAEMISYQALAIGYSTFYLTENADGIRQERSYECR